VLVPRRLLRAGGGYLILFTTSSSVACVQEGRTIQTIRGMPHAEKKLNPIPPNPPRWEPSIDPASIHVPGLDTSAPVNDQIDQIEQLTTLKLQVRCLKLKSPSNV
jgi:hypothetical protein